MKKKIMIWIGAICLLSFIVYALQYGDILTQQQVDALNVDNINLNCQWLNTGEGNGFIVNNGFILREKECNFFRKDWGTGEYEYIRPQSFTQVAPIETWKKCRARNSVSECKEGFKILSDIILYDEEIRLRQMIKQTQTQAIEGMT